MESIRQTSKFQRLLEAGSGCNNHNIYYYSRYSECPLCNQNTKFFAIPVVTKVNQTANGSKITIVFSRADCVFILSKVHYLNKYNEAVHIESGRKFKVEKGKRVDFSDDGKIVFLKFFIKNV